MIPIGLVGCAHIHTPGFVKSLLTRPNLKVTSVWDPNPARSQKRANDLGAIVVNDPADIWTNKDITAVIICSETNRHQELVAAGAKSRKHLFVEKPLGMGSKDSFAMAKAIEKAKVIFSTGYFMRGFAINLFLKEQVDKGTFGKITRIRGSNCHSGALGDWFAAKPQDPADDWRWMADPSISGVGAFGDLGTHSLDIMLWLMGDVESVTACTGTGIQRYRNSAGFCDETGEGLLKFKNGAIGSLAAAWDDVANPVSLMISGTEAHAAVINNKLFFKCDTLGIKDDQPYEQLPAALPAGFDCWLNAISGDTSARVVPVREAALRPAVMEAMYKGAATGKWVVPKAPRG